MPRSYLPTGSGPRRLRVEGWVAALVDVHDNGYGVVTLAAACARRAVAALGVGYAAAVTGYAAGRPLLGDRKGWIELVDDLEPWAYLPAPLFAVAGLALRSRGLAGAGFALAAAFGLRWGARYLRRGPDRAALAGDLTFMTFNTLAWNRRTEDIAASILAADPDVVGLQEIGPVGADHLASALGGRYPHRFVSASADPSGAAVFSKLPLRDPVAYRGSPQGHWWQRMTIDTPRGPVTYVNVHTKIPHVHRERLFGLLTVPRRFHAGRRLGEVRSLCDLVRASDGPVVIGGDFNMTERSEDYRLLAAVLRDAYRAVGVGLGHTFPRTGSYPRPFPAPWPTLRLDYLWHSDHFTAAWSYRGEAGESDHHPVVVGLRWSEPAAGLAGSGAVPLAASAV